MVEAVYVCNCGSLMCAFSICRFSQTGYVTAFLFHGKGCVGSRDSRVTRDIDKIICHPVNISERLWAENGC